MSKISILRGSTLYFFSKIVEYSIAFIFVVIATRVLGTSQYGLIALSITIITIINNLGSFGLGFVAKKKLPGELNDEKRSIFAAMIIINIISAVLFFLLIFFGNTIISNQIFKKPNLTPVLAVMSISILFLIPLSLYSEVLNAQKKITMYFIINISKSLFRLLSLILIFLISSNLLAISLTLPISIFIALLLAIFFIIKEKILPKFSNIKIHFSQTYKLGFQFLLIGLGYFLLSQTDKVMLGILDTSKSVGIYSIASSIALISSYFHSSMTMNFMPIISDLYKKNNLDRIKEIYHFSNLLVVIVNAIIIIFLIVSGQVIFRFIFGISDKDLYYVFCLLCIVFYIGTISGPTGAFLNMLNKHKLELKNTIFILFLNIILNYILISKFSIYGAVIATLIAVLVLNILQIVEIYISFSFYILKLYHLKIIASLSSVLIIYFLFMNKIDSYLLNFLFLIISELFIILSAWLTMEKNYRQKIILLLKEYFNTKNKFNYR